MIVNTQTSLHTITAVAHKHPHNTPNPALTLSATAASNMRASGARPKGSTAPLDQRDMQLELTPEQLVGIMDHLLGLEATWHNGGALPCTLYSSIYMMQPDR